MAQHFEIAQIVISKRGKDCGERYLISGFASDGRLNLIRPPRFNISCPKKKNPKHVQSVYTVSERCLPYIKSGRDIDTGFFRRSVVN